MSNYISGLEFDEESDYILEVIENYEKQGLTTNVDFVRAEEEKLIIAKKYNLNLEQEILKLNKEETLEENVNLTKDEIKVLVEINNKKDVFDLVM